LLPKVAVTELAGVCATLVFAAPSINQRESSRTIRLLLLFGKCRAVKFSIFTAPVIAGKFKALFGRKLIMTLKLSANTLWNRCCSRCRNLSTDGFSKEKLKNCRN